MNGAQTTLDNGDDGVSLPSLFLEDTENKQTNIKAEKNTESKEPHRVHSKWGDIKIQNCSRRQKDGHM